MTIQPSAPGSSLSSSSSSTSSSSGASSLDRQTIFLNIASTTSNNNHYVMNKIIDGLFVGNIRDSKNVELLKRHQISHILSIHDTADRGVQIQGIKYLCICIADSPHQNIIKYIPKCNDFIHKARLTGGNVLIHCLAGMSRSVTIVAAYLMSVTSLSSNEALDAIRAVRSISAPNPGFYKQLLDFEMYRLRQERIRINSELLVHFQQQQQSQSSTTTTASTSSSNQIYSRQNDEAELRKLLSQ